MTKMIILCVSLIIAYMKHISATPEIYFQTQTIKVAELYTIKVQPEMFNWNGTLFGEQFRYRPSLRGKPNLPLWMSFQFSKERNVGYIYGSPTSSYANRKFDIEIVGLNKQTYETRRVIVSFDIVDNKIPATRIEMKITNLNWVHLTDLGRVENLKGIFTNDLWPESLPDLNIIFMESAVRLGSRIPLKPQNREGVIVHLGSNAPLSSRLKELNDELKPLSKLSTCTFKKTRVQTIFQSAGLQIDWCAFKIINEEPATTEEPKKEEAEMLSRKIWNSPTKDELPDRNYSEEMAVAIAIPSVWFAFLVAMLTIVLCFNHEKLHDEESNKFIDSLFELCNPNAKKSGETTDEPKSSQPVQMVQYSGNDRNPPTTTLKSLHDPYDDNLSLGSHSPTSSVFREGSPHMSATFLRPKPPAYKVPPRHGESSGHTVRFENNI